MEGQLFTPRHAAVLLDAACFSRVLYFQKRTFTNIGIIVSPSSFPFPDHELTKYTMLYRPTKRVRAQHKFCVRSSDDHLKIYLTWLPSPTFESIGFQILQTEFGT